IRIVLTCIALALVSAAASGVAAAEHAAGPVIETHDVDRFYEIFDRANGRPSAEVLQREYLDAGSEGLHTLARMRNVTGASIAKAIETRPEIYASARECLKVLPRVREEA